MRRDGAYGLQLSSNARSRSTFLVKFRCIGEGQTWTRNYWMSLHLLYSSLNTTGTKWSPNWSRTRDHRSTSDNTKRTGAIDFAIRVNTYRDKTKRGDTALNKF